MWFLGMVYFLFVEVLILNGICVMWRSMMRGGGIRSVFFIVKCNLFIFVKMLKFKFLLCFFMIFFCFFLSVGIMCFLFVMVSKLVYVDVIEDVCWSAKSTVINILRIWLFVSLLLFLYWVLMNVCKIFGLFVLFLWWVWIILLKILVKFLRVAFRLRCVSIGAYGKNIDNGIIFLFKLCIRLVILE